MHCPNCSAAVETEATSFCTRCGQDLDRVRAAMGDTVIQDRNLEPSHANLNLGVALMYVGLWPVLLSIIYAPIGLPGALLILTAVWLFILLGSGPLLRLLQHYDMPKEIERARRLEIAFGSTLMFLATILASTILTVVTDRSLGADGTLILAITGVFMLLLASSRLLYQGYGNLVRNAPKEIDTIEQGSLTTGSLDDSAVRLPAADARSFVESLTPPSVIEGTTRNLKRDVKNASRE